MRLSKVLRIMFCLMLAGAGAFMLLPASFSGQGSTVEMIQLDDDTINPVTAEYIIKAIDKAHEDGAECLVIKMDTPGGLLNSTRMIVKKMLTSEVPIVVYIAPSGSRAGSAGVFITYASHVAAMAPSTNIGAAHPVQMGGSAPKRDGDWGELRRLIEELKEAKGTKEAVEEGSEPPTEREAEPSAQAATEQPSDQAAGQKAPEPEHVKEEELKDDDDPMASKILNDTVAFIKSIAKQRGRNIEWAVDSVAKSDSITSEEAFEKGVVEIIAKSDRDLLEQLDGRAVMVNGKEVVLKTKDAYIQSVDMDARQKFFNVLANPNIAYFLMILGFYGLLFEVTHPGFGVPGILGIVFLILAFYSMQTLPTNYAGLALMALGLALLVAEAYTPTFGALTLGGITCLVLGSMLLFESADPVMRVSKEAIIAFSLTTAAITLFLMRSVIMVHRTKVQGGQEGLIGSEGEAQTPLKSGKKGKVFVHGELWNAFSDEDIHKDDTIVVEEIKGLTLKVRKK